MLNLAGIDSPVARALIGVLLLVVGVVVNGPLLMAVGGALAAWGVASFLIGREE
jgi:hypothetical protein